MSTLRTISYQNMLYETLRSYFSLNASGDASVLYRFMSCLAFPLQGPFNAFIALRVINLLVSQCAWQIGQLTNVLNILYDATLKRIYITQSSTTILSAPSFYYTSPVQVRGFDAPAQAQARSFTDTSNTSIVTINIPASINLSSIRAVIEQIRLDGIPYQIQTF